MRAVHVSVRVAPVRGALSHTAPIKVLRYHYYYHYYYYYYYYYYYIKPILRELQWLPLAERTQHVVLSTVYRSVKGYAPGRACRTHSFINPDS